jgi:hypothetical protein
MDRIEVIWCESVEDDAPQGTENSIRFRVVEEWVATDQDQLLLPVTLLERDGEELDESVPSILKQYGGEQVLNSMLLSDQDLEVGSEWEIRRTKHRRTVEPTNTD